MTTTFSRCACAQHAFAAKLVAFSAACLLALSATDSLAGDLVFTLDPTQSYVQLAIPNFSYSGNVINIRGQNPVNGLALQVDGWSTTTGNQAFVSGTMSTNITGNLSAGIVNSVQFLAGANNLVALNSGNFRPNYAAYNTLTSNYNNNTATGANYAATPHAGVGNAGLTSFSNTTYDIGTPVSLGVVGNQFPVNAVGNAVTAGILSTNFAVEGLSIFLVGQVLPNDTSVLTNLTGENQSTDPGTFTFTNGGTNLQVKVPLVVPFSVDLGGGVFLNGTSDGFLVANAPVPEPSTFALAGLGVAVLAMVARRRRLQASRGVSS